MKSLTERFWELIEHIITLPEVAVHEDRAHYKRFTLENIAYKIDRVMVEPEHEDYYIENNMKVPQPYILVGARSLKKSFSHPDYITYTVNNNLIKTRNNIYYELLDYREKGLFTGKINAKSFKVTAIGQIDANPMFLLLTKQKHGTLPYNNAGLVQHYIGIYNNYDFFSQKYKHVGKWVNKYPIRVIANFLRFRGRVRNYTDSFRDKLLPRFNEYYSKTHQLDLDTFGIDAWEHVEHIEEIVSNIFGNITRDTFLMYKMLKGKSYPSFNWLLSEKRYEQLHEEYVLEINLEKTKLLGKNINYDKHPEVFEFYPKKNADLQWIGKKYNNCAYGYLDVIERGACVVFEYGGCCIEWTSEVHHVVDPDTGEITDTDKFLTKYRIAQIKYKHNQRVPQEERDRIAIELSTLTDREVILSEYCW